ncbi:hypothetical protein ET989_02005 [Propioniciclava sinopodophylli]|uniref:Uncharacterized protein n=1 Tax=Propioniciclava sinopodophylli TaxID=1837344 RepID=A0A4Q9KHA3_9ACTN|nr:hypothetical protein [Propioniciclava sinopodophylli]TBT88730.1 hypothetical protein ET989_02005 [Propioniciclava sinopodophylli]
MCGWRTNGLIQTHFIPAADDFGMFALPVVMAADIGLGLWFFSVFYGLDWVATVLRPSHCAASTSASSAPAGCSPHT